MTKLFSKFLSKLKPYSPSLPISLVLLIVFFIISNLIKGEISKSSNHRFETSISIETTRTTKEIRDLVNDYGHLLGGARGFFTANENVTREEWKEYVESQGLGGHHSSKGGFPSLSAFGYIKKIDADETLEYEKSVRDEGYRDFVIDPPISSEESRYIVHYLEPYEENEEAHGFDLFSNSSRKKAIEFARDTNSFVLTEPISLVQEKNSQKAFLIIMPVYKSGSDILSLEGRRKNIIGLVSAVVRAGDFFNQVTKLGDLSYVEELSVEDVTNGVSVLIPSIDNNGKFDFNKSSGFLPEVEYALVNLGSRTWRIKYGSTKHSEITAIEKLVSDSVFIAGLLISILVGFIVFNSGRLQSKAEGIAAEITKDLAKFKLAVEGASDHIIITDADGKILYANPASNKMTGYSQKEIIGSTPNLWGKQMNLNFYEKMWSDIKKTKKTFIGELSNKRKNGSFYDVEAYISPILDKNGVVNYFVGIERDVSKENQIKNLLKQEKILKESQSESILATIKEGIVITNASAEIEYINPYFIEMMGYSLKDIKGEEFSSKIPAFDMKDKKINQIFVSDSAVITNKKSVNKFLLQSKNGDKVAVNISAAPINLGDEFKGVVRVIHDNREQHKLQKQKDDFFAIASHELRTPLTVISGSIDNVLQGVGKSKLTKEDKSALEDSIAASDSLIKMVGDFLNVSRLDQGRMRVDIAEVDLCKVTDGVVKSFALKAKEKGLKLVSACTNKHLKLMADESLLIEILINLIGNSLKFTTKGEIKIEHYQEDEWIITKLTDTGSGIEKKMQKYLFQRFQQAMERTMKREAGGTGLGLYISKEFAKQMGGDLTLTESTLGKGSTFELRLPLPKGKKLSKTLA